MVQPGDTAWGYGSGHTAPSDRSYDAPMHDVSDMMPGFYDGHHGDYMHGNDGDWESVNKILRVHNRPDAKVRIYRAVPHGVTKIYGRNDLQQMFPDVDHDNLGEWVGISKEYAQEHARSNSCPKCHKQLQVISGIAHARDLLNEGYPTEWGYVGDATLEHSGANRIYKTKCPAPRKTRADREREYDEEMARRYPDGDEYHQRFGTFNSDNLDPEESTYQQWWQVPDKVRSKAWSDWQKANPQLLMHDVDTFGAPEGVVYYSPFRGHPGDILTTRDPQWPEESSRSLSPGDDKTGVFQPMVDVSGRHNLADDQEGNDRVWGQRDHFDWSPQPGNSESGEYGGLTMPRRRNYPWRWEDQDSSSGTNPDSIYKEH